MSNSVLKTYNYRDQEATISISEIKQTRLLKCLIESFQEGLTIKSHENNIVVILEYDTYVAIMDFIQSQDENELLKLEDGIRSMKRKRKLKTLRKYSNVSTE